MAASRVFFSDLKVGKCSSAVEARLLRFWEAKNVKRGGELMWVDMLMVDVNATVMQATIGASRLARFRHKLTAGKVYTVSGFDVGQCAQNFRLSNSSLQIRFNESTSFDELTEPVSPLPEEAAGFRTSLNVIGEIISVKSTVCDDDDPAENNRVMATVKLDNDTTVTLSLFDAQAVTFHKQLQDKRVDPRVIVATSINPKMVGGRLYLNATSGTHIYFDKETKAGEDYFYRLVSRETGLTSAAPLLRGYAKLETLTIAELNAFISSASSQEIDFICTGKVGRVDIDKGWCYVACSKCSKKLQRTVSALECVRCNNVNAVGTLHYRVELSIADDTAEGAFVCFDGVMTKLHNLRASDASQMLIEEGVNPEKSNVPPFITDMEGKTFTFQVKVNPYNFTAHHQTFTITRILSKPEAPPVPDFVANGGNGGDDGDLPDGTTHHVESGGRSIDAEVSVDMNPTGAAPKKRGRPASNTAKKARVA
ncbi:hypothetical protein Bca52824_017116 [Brassica carinata]|uniref:Replication factor A C-terminal domain-containing protein n=1 Tax=Brassica carinata TaxID=52824 RepID=A0A8X7VM15_BRACI|nr:hypothetical protein Bca52824_017116 [Brassica carinata]